jgi:hypothetical protein
LREVDDDRLTDTGLADLEAVGAGRLDLRVRGAEGACGDHVRGGEPPGLVPLVWSGIHFRTADVVGIETGTQVGDWALDNYFQPTNER